MGFQDLKILNENLARIDAKQQQINTLRSQNPDAYERIAWNWAVTSSYNSNAIEGSTMTLGDTALVFEGVDDLDADPDEIAQSKGAKAAINYMRELLKIKAPLSETLILAIHKLVYEDALIEAARGSYRTTEVEITGTSFEPCPAMYVPERMAELIASIVSSKRHPAIVAALFHLEFESIHPFVNANGRTGRLLSNYLLMLNGYEPTNIQASGRADYIAALRAFQLNDDPYPFVRLFVDNLEQNIDKTIELLTAAKRDSSSKAYSATLNYLRGADE